MQPLTYVLENTGKTSTKWISPLVIVQCVPALDVKMLLRRAPRPPTLTLRLTNLRLGCKRHGKFLRVARLQNEVGTKYI